MLGDKLAKYFLIPISRRKLSENDDYLRNAGKNRRVFSTKLEILSFLIEKFDF